LLGTPQGLALVAEDIPGITGQDVVAIHKNTDHTGLTNKNMDFINQTKY
jgi:hypothetical protein